MNLVRFKSFAGIGVLSEILDKRFFGIDVQRRAIFNGEFFEGNPVYVQGIILIGKMLCHIIVYGNVGSLPGRMPKGALSDSGLSVSGSGRFC